VSPLFDYGEFLLCIGSIFSIIAAIGFGLLVYSWPKKETSKEEKEEDE